MYKYKYGSMLHDISKIICMPYTVHDTCIGDKTILHFDLEGEVTPADEIVVEILWARYNRPALPLFLEHVEFRSNILLLRGYQATPGHY